MQRLGKMSYRVITTMLVLLLSVGMFTSCSKDKKSSTNSGDGSTSKGNVAAISTPGDSSGKGDEALKKTVALTDPILTVDDRVYTLQDLMYIIYSFEYSADLYASEQAISGIDYWNDKDEETGLTGREIEKQNAIENAELIAVLYDKALEEGYKLDEDELTILNEEVDSILSSMSDDYKKQTGLTVDNLKKQILEAALASKYLEAELDKIEVDRELIASDYEYEDYAQYEVEYIYLSTVYYDANFNVVYYSPEEITEILKQAQAMLTDIKAGKSFEEVALNLEDADFGNMAVYLDPEKADEALYEAVKNLKVGQLYDGVVESDDGYYILRLVDDKCTEAYDEAIDEAVYWQQNAIFMEEYDKMATKYKITLNEDNWNNVEFGNLAYESYDEDMAIPEDTDGELEDPFEGDLNGDEGTVG